MQREPRRLATTANFTGALSRDTLVPELNLPVNVPLATTPLAVAWKLVMVALIESVEGAAARANLTDWKPDDHSALDAEKFKRHGRSVWIEFRVALALHVRLTQ